MFVYFGTQTHTALAFRARTFPYHSSVQRAADTRRWHSIRQREFVEFDESYSELRRARQQANFPGRIPFIPLVTTLAMSNIGRSTKTTEFRQNTRKFCARYMQHSAFDCVDCDFG